MSERTLDRPSEMLRRRHPRPEAPASVHHGRAFPRQTATHDHAWRRLSSRGEEPALLEGRYRCDLCSAEWAL